MVEPMNFGSMPRYSASPSDRHAALGGGAEQAVDVFQAQAAIVERAPRALRHQVDDRHAVGHLAEIRFRNADDGRAAPLEPVHHAPSAGVKTG